jgi:diguanylate cyclase (GGDEF)-like protein
MSYYPLDLKSLTHALESLSALTGFHYSVYDDQLHRIISPMKEDALLLFVKSTEKGRELYQSFIEEQVRCAQTRNNPLMRKSFTRQYHLIIPVQYKELTLVAVAEAFYESASDFESFYEEYYSKLALPVSRKESLRSQIAVISAATVAAQLRRIHSLVKIIVASECEKGELNKKWRSSKTIVSLMASVDANTDITNIYRYVVDAVIFLFDVDSAAVFCRRKQVFSADVSAGRLREVIQGIRIPVNSPFFSQAPASGKPVLASDEHELRQWGLPEEIVSMYLFPIASGFGDFGYLAVVNSFLDSESLDAVHELCVLSSSLCGIRQRKEEYERETSFRGLVLERISNLNALFREPDRLYEGIVNDVSSLVGAEKCSLMMPEFGEKILRVLAAKGADRWLMGNIKVMPGEGIAGRVFEKGEPILTDREEVIRKYTDGVKPRYRTPSSISVPLKVANETIGVLTLSDKYSGEPFSDNDITTVAHFASQASVILRLSDYYEQSEQMRELSITDPLTGLFNRRYFNIRLDEESQRAKRYGLPVSLVLMDIDNFKLFNDTEGHLAGDHILKEIATVMSAAVRANDILVRFGGEEFVILMPQTEKEDALRVSERIRKNVREQIPLSWGKFPAKHITISAGISMYPECGGLKDHLVRCADRALYKAKIMGKDRICLWESGDYPSEEKS